MRRKDFQNNESALFDEMAEHCPEGYLALNGGDNFPRAVGVNFAARDGRIYFHGAVAGDKFERLKTDDRVGFTLARPYSLLPSVWSTSDGSACPATQLYISIEICGRCRLVDDPAEKGRGLQALMEKYQPEGGYRPMDRDDDSYKRPIAAVGVFRIDIENWTGKVRMAQNQSEASRRDLIARLKERGRPLDLETAARITESLDGAKPS